MPSIETDLVARARDGIGYFWRVYRYRRSILGGAGLPDYPTSVFWQVFARVVMQRKKILFLPESPKPLFVIYKILLFLGYRITDDSSRRVKLAMKWLNALDGSPFLPPVAFLSELVAKPLSVPVINLNCHDVSKKQVSKTFEKVFGYSASVDPQTYRGRCVMKSNWNGLHIGQILECPTVRHEGDFVYEKLINNEMSNGYIQDIRVPIFKNKIPLVYIKQRASEDRLVDRKHTAKHVQICEPSQYLSEEEIRKIIHFCETMGLDYGEIDVLRDKYEGKIYIVDVNNNPAGPPEPISTIDGNMAIIRLAKAFENAFAP